MEHEQNLGVTKIVPSMVALGLGWDACRSVLNRVGVDANWGVQQMTPPPHTTKLGWAGYTQKYSKFTKINGQYIPINRLVQNIL